MEDKSHAESEDYIQMERDYCSRSLLNFVERAWPIVEPGTPFINGWAMAAICEHYQAITEGQIKRLLVTVPPGLSKSTIGSVMHNPWEWGPAGMPHIRMVSASFRGEHAVRDTRKTRMIIQSSWFQRLWPMKITSDQNVKSYFENDSRGSRQCCGIKSITGLRGDRISWDDPISVMNARSPVFIKEANDIFHDSLHDRINSNNSSISIIMQRLAKDDVAHHAIGAGYVHLMLPMEYESSRKCITIIGFEDPRKEDGELLFPERFSAELVEDKKGRMSRDAYASQHQQRPNPIGGSIIKSKDFGLYEDLPNLEYREIYADTAMKTKEHNDYSVLQCWGADKEGKIYLLDQMRGKWEAPELKRRSIEFWAKNMRLNNRVYGVLRKMWVEDKASGTGLIQSLRLEGRIPIAPIKEDNMRMTDSRSKDRGNKTRVAKDKYTRVCDALSAIESCMVYLPKNVPWLADFLDECESFTADNTHPHDDQVDTMVYAIINMVVNNVSPWWKSITG